MSYPSIRYGRRGELEPLLQVVDAGVDVPPPLARPQLLLLEPHVGVVARRVMQPSENAAAGRADPHRLCPARSESPTSSRSASRGRLAA